MVVNLMVCQRPDHLECEYEMTHGAANELILCCSDAGDLRGPCPYCKAAEVEIKVLAD